MKTQLTPKQVARAIQVSESSVKRWCDRGVIPTERTAGGHRRIPIGGMLEFLRKTRHQLARPEVLGLPATTGQTQRVVDRASDQVCSALVLGDEQLCRQIVFDLYLAGHSFSVLCDLALARAFEAIGSRWECGTAEVYQERRGCEICMRLLHELSLLLPPQLPSAPLALGGTPEGDRYSLPTSMVELVLRSMGWQAASLGTNLPFDTLVAAIRENQPRLFWLSVSHVADEAALIEGCERLFEAAAEHRVALALGGRALVEPLRQRLKYSVFCDDMQRLECFARTLYIPAEPIVLPQDGEDDEYEDEAQLES